MRLHWVGIITQQLRQPDLGGAEGGLLGEAKKG